MGEGEQKTVCKHGQYGLPEDRHEQNGSVVSWGRQQPSCRPNSFHQTICLCRQPLLIIDIFGGTEGARIKVDNAAVLSQPLMDSDYDQVLVGLRYRR
jgi:hypothetical protein